MTVCSISLCDRKTVARGYCDKHYRRVRKHGAPITVRYCGPLTLEYLYGKTRQNKETGCFEWQGNKTKQGYGAVKPNKFGTLAHRATWAAAHGGIPKEMCVLHRCDNPACINIEHLFLGTQKDNILDMLQKGRCGDHSGVNNGKARLTESDVHYIRRSTLSPKVLSRRFGVTRSAIYSVKNGKNWKHIK